MAEKAARQFISSLLYFDRLANRLFAYILIPCFGYLSVLPPTIPMLINDTKPKSVDVHSPEATRMTSSIFIHV